MIGQILTLNAGSVWIVGLAGGLAARRRTRATLTTLLLLTAVIAALILSEVGQASAQRVLSVTASPTAIQARGGQSTITVRVPVSAAGSEHRVELSTELGAFQASSGPSEISTALDDVGNDTLGASVRLVGDGRAGATVVTARVGSLVDTVTVRLVGDPTELRLLTPAEGSSLDASRQHQIRFVATDSAGVRVPSATVSVELLEAPDGATLRGGGALSERSLDVATSQSGEASVSLSSSPGGVRIQASSGTASLTSRFRLFGAPTTLRIVPVAGSAIERGTVGDAGSLQVLLLDERGQGVPNRRIRFMPEGGLVVSAAGDGESLITDDAGSVRVHLDAGNARLGARKLTATWTSGDLMLSDELEISVTGPPAAMYLTAKETLTDVGEPLIEEFAALTRYRVTAEVVDELGQPVAGEYLVRWRPLVSEAPAHVDPIESTTSEGIAVATFSLAHDDAAPQIESTWAQAWLVAKAQVNNRGLIADLMGEGVPLRASWNRLVWQGPDLPVSIVVDRIKHVVSAAWRRTEDGRWQAWFSAGVPGAVDFTLHTGDEFLLVLHSAALLPNVERR